MGRGVKVRLAQIHRRSFAVILYGEISYVFLLLLLFGVCVIPEDWVVAVGEKEERVPGAFWAKGRQSKIG